MKKITSILLSLMMVMCFMPSLSFADDASESLDGAVITLTNNTVTYNGQSQSPSISATLSGGTTPVAIDKCNIEYSTDAAFSTTTSAVSNAGTYYVKLTPKDTTTYAGSATGGSFTINKASLDSASYDAITVPVGSSSSAIEASAVNLYLNGKAISADEFTIGTTPDHNTSGNYSLVLTAKGPNFTGTKTLTFAAGNELKSSNCTVTTSTETFTYDGSAKTYKTVTVKTTEGAVKELKAGTDYIISYRNNINAHNTNPTLIVKGIGNYMGTIEKSFSISTKNISSVSFENLGNVVVNSNPKPKITDGTRNLVEGKDFDYTYSNTANSVTVTVTGRENYTGAVSKTYAAGTDIISAEVITYPSSVVLEYTGYAVKPTYIIVKYNGTTLKEGTNYSVSYLNNVNVGSSAQFTINGMGSYGGKLTRNFIITPRYIKSTEITLGTKTYAYDGTAKTPSVSVYSGGRTLTANVDYTVSYLSNTNPGTATVSVSGKGNYTGTATATFTITGTDISKCTGTLSQSSYSYTGYACSPTVIVKNGTKTLSNGTDYTVTYKNNIYTGTATAVVTGKNAYSGTLNLNYTINGKANTVLVDRTSYDKYKNSYPFKITPTSAGDETGFIFVSSDLTVAQVSATGVVTIVGTGKTVITISTVGNKAYNPASETVTVTVKPLKATPKLYTTSKGKLKVRVTKATGVTKYQIRYGRAGSYKYYYMSYANNSFTTQSKTFSKLKSGYKYYVKVRPYKLASDGTKVYGNWSSTKSIRIK